MADMIDFIRTYLEQYISAEQLDISYFGNTLSDYLVTVVFFVGLLVVFKVFQMVIVARLNKFAKTTKTDIDDTLIKVVNSLRPPFYFFVAFYLALQGLTLADTLEKALTILLILWVVYQVVIAIQILIDYVVRKRMDEDAAEGHTESVVSLLSLLSKIILWSVGLLFALSNIGIDVTSLIAAMGIGGIAIAFALQNILSDLFSSFAIYFDKPFVPGDVIVVGDKVGIVEKIGIKTTRVRALQGEEIVFSNKELTSAQIQNFKKLEERRVVLSLGATYSTPTEKLKKLPTQIKDVIENVEKARFDRAHFRQFADSALVIEVVYYAGTSDYTEYMNINQSVHLGLKELFEKEGIDFAFPTQTIHLEK
ncbi:mechanosensitive ion channel protein MscS [bacterium]|nr:mechanosensitive ion channel protein MscS [bacterium]|tara:strand:- start:3842 stop:4936 length:1095 start_codon:yes stop_codon:yes gene_type:complete